MFVPVEAVGAVGVPVKAALARGALVAILFVTVVEKFASSPDLSAKADLASPALTGNPTAPTQSASDNSTKIATTAYADTAVANIVDSSPAALNTLNELAAALGDDENFSTTVTNSIATKAPLANPVLTGTPAAPTASTGTNTTQIATTAFVKQEIDALKALLYAYDQS